MEPESKTVESPEPEHVHAFRRVREVYSIGSGAKLVKYARWWDVCECGKKQPGKPRRQRRDSTHAKARRDFLRVAMRLAHTAKHGRTAAQRKRATAELALLSGDKRGEP